MNFKLVLAIIYTYVDVIEPIVLIISALLFFLYFFVYEKKGEEKLLKWASGLTAVSAALTLIIIINWFF